MGREAVRKDENIEALALVQKAKKELDESYSDLKTHEEGIRQLGPRDWPAYNHMRAIDESAEAYEKFFAKASMNRVALSEIQSVSESYIRRTFELDYLVSVRGKEQSGESQATISAYEKELDSLIRAELACVKALEDFRALPEFKKDQQRFEELLEQVPADGSILDKNLLSALKELGRKLDLLEDEYNSKKNAFYKNYADLKAAQEAYNQAFIDMVVKTTR